MSERQWIEQNGDECQQASKCFRLSMTNRCTWFSFANYFSFCVIPYHLRWFLLGWGFTCDWFMNALFLPMSTMKVYNIRNTLFSKFLRVIANCFWKYCQNTPSLRTLFWNASFWRQFRYNLELFLPIITTSKLAASARELAQTTKDITTFRWLWKYQLDNSQRENERLPLFSASFLPTMKGINRITTFSFVDSWPRKCAASLDCFLLLCFSTFCYLLKASPDLGEWVEFYFDFRLRFLRGYGYTKHTPFTLCIIIITIFICKPLHFF